MQFINLEEYLNSRMKEMSSFYSSLNLQNESLQQQTQADTQSQYSQQNANSIHKLEQSNIYNEFVQEPNEPLQEYKDIFDDIPIKGAAKPFEQLLEEQGIAPIEIQNKKTFLKKGTRQFLSNAQIRSELSKKEHEEILKLNNENDQPKKQMAHFLQKGKGKQCTNKINDSILDNSNSNLNDNIKITQNGNQSYIEDKLENEKLKKMKQNIEQQQKELQKQQLDWQKQVEYERNELEKFKEEEKKKIERLKQKHYTIQQQRQQQLTKKQVEELDFLRKKVQQQNEEIKELKLLLEKTNRKQSNSPTNIIKTNQQNNDSGKKSNSYAIMHQKGCIEEQEEYSDDNYEENNKLNEEIIVEEFEQQNIIEQIDLIQLKNTVPISIDMINKQIKEEQFEFQNNKYYQQYLEFNKKEDKIIQQNQQNDGKISRTYQSGKKEVIFNNGVKREIFPDGYIIVHFINNDIKQTFPDGIVVYYFYEAKTTQITITPQGPNIYRFINKQIEIHFQDGGKQIRFADGTQKYIFPTGEEETFFNDGIFQKTDINKVKFVEYPNGSMDIIYPDGRKELKKINN